MHEHLETPAQDTVVEEIISRRDLVKKYWATFERLRGEAWDIFSESDPAIPNEWIQKYLTPDGKGFDRRIFAYDPQSVDYAPLILDPGDDREEVLDYLKNNRPSWIGIDDVHFVRPFLRELHLSWPEGVSATISIDIGTATRIVDVLQFGTLQIQLEPLSLHPNNDPLLSLEQFNNNPDIQSATNNPDTSVLVNLVRASESGAPAGSFDPKGRNPHIAGITFFREAAILLETLQYLGYRVIFAHPSDSRRLRVYEHLGMTRLSDTDYMIGNVESLIARRHLKKVA